MNMSFALNFMSMWVSIDRFSIHNLVVPSPFYILHLVLVLLTILCRNWLRELEYIWVINEELHKKG